MPRCHIVFGAERVGRGEGGREGGREGRRKRRADGRRERSEVGGIDERRQR